MTFQRIAGLMRSHPGKLLITGEDRFLGYSLMLGARAALVGMGAALPDVQADLLRHWRAGETGRLPRRSALCDRFAQVTFVAAHGGVHPPDALGRGGGGGDSGGCLRRSLGSAAAARRSVDAVERMVRACRAALAA